MGVAEAPALAGCLRQAGLTSISAEGTSTKRTLVGTTVPTLTAKLTLFTRGTLLPARTVWMPANSTNVACSKSARPKHDEYWYRDQKFHPRLDFQRRRVGQPRRCAKARRGFPLQPKPEHGAVGAPRAPLKPCPL